MAFSFSKKMITTFAFAFSLTTGLLSAHYHGDGGHWHGEDHHWDHWHDHWHHDHVYFYGGGVGYGIGYPYYYGPGFYDPYYGSASLNVNLNFGG